MADNAITTSDLNATLTFADGDFLDLGSIVHDDTAVQGLRLPNTSSATPSSPSSGEGYLAWDANGNQVIAYSGSSWTVVGTGDITAVTAGSGLTGGGTSGDVTLTVGAGTGITVNADDVAINQAFTPTWTGAHTFEGNVTISDSAADTIILGNSLDTLSIASTAFTVSSAGTVSGVTTLALSGDITWSATTPNIAITNGQSLTITDGTNTLLTLADGGSSGNLTVSGDLAVNGGDLTSTATTFNFDIGNTGTLNFRDGTNSLVAIKDQGAFPFLSVAGKSTTGDPSTCSEGDLYYNATDDTIQICHASNVWERLDGAGAVWSDISNPSGNLSLSHAERTTTFTWDTAATAAAFDGFTLALTNDASTDTATQRVLVVKNNSATGGTTDTLLRIDNADDSAVTTGLEIVGSSTGSITTAIDLSDVEIDKALDLGANRIVGTTTQIDFSNFDVSTGGTVTLADGQSYTGTNAVTFSSGAALTIDSGSNTITLAASDTTVTATGLATLTSSTSLNLNPNTGSSYTLATSATTLNLFSTNATTVNFAGVATTELKIGSTTTGLNTFSADVDMTFAGSENLTLSNTTHTGAVDLFEITQTLTGDVSSDGLSITVTNNNASAVTGTNYGLNLVNADNTTNTSVIDALALFSNDQATETLADGVIIRHNAASGTLTDGLQIENTTAGGTITNAINIVKTAGTITTGINIGSATTGINFESGTGVELNFQDTSPMIQVANTGSITFEDSDGTDILVLQDINNAGNHVLSGNGNTGLSLSGMTTDLTTGTNESLTIAPNGTGDLEVTIDSDSNVKLNLSGTATATFLNVAYDSAATLGVGAAITGAVIDLSTNVTLDVGGNAQTGLSILVTSGGSSTTTGLAIAGAADIGLDFNSTSITTDIEFQNDETLDNNTDATFTFGRNDAGTVTILAKDNDATAGLTISSGGTGVLTLDPTGAGSIVIGSADVTGITLTTSASSLVNVLTGNLKIGDGTPDVSLDGEDAYIEGTLEVDGNVRFDGVQIDNGTATFNSDVDFSFVGSENITLSNTSASTDQLALTVSGVTTDGVDGLAVSIGTAAGAGVNNSGLHVTIANAPVDASDVINGLEITGVAQTVASTTQNLLFIDPAASGNTAGTLNGLKIDSITGSSATETGISIGSGWDTGIDFNNNSALNIGDAGTDISSSGMTLGVHLTLSGDANEGLSGGGLSDCDNASASKLLWDTTTNKFSCGSDQGSSVWSTFTAPVANQAEMNHAEFVTSWLWDTGAAGAAFDGWTLGMLNDGTGTNSQRLMVLNNRDDAGTNGVTEGLLVINNADANEAVTAGIQFANTGGGGFTAGIDMANLIITNIGAAGTDFTSTGGLTLDDILTVNDDVTVSLVTDENVDIDTTGTGNSGDGTRTLDVSGSWGGNTVVDDQIANCAATRTQSTRALVYRFSLSVDAGAASCTFNITGLPNTNGTFAYIWTEVDDNSAVESNTVNVQINGVQVSTVNSGVAGTTPVHESYTLVRVSDAWRAFAVSATAPNGADLAEWIEYTGKKPEAGELVSIVNGVKVTRSSKSYDKNVAGIVTTEPHTVMGTKTESSVAMALAGRVPVKVSPENGPIQAGDYITSSSTPGVGMKAVKAGKIVGQVLEDYNGEGEGVVMVLVGNGYYGGEDFAAVLPEGLEVSGGASQESPVNASPTDLGDSSSLVQNDTSALDVKKLLAKSDPALVSQLAPNSNQSEVLGTQSSTPAIAESEFARLSEEGSLTIDKPVEFKNHSLFVALVEFISNVIFRGDVTFLGRPKFNSDTAGEVVIAKGSREAAVSFAKEYETLPIVNATIMLDKVDDMSVQESLEEGILQGDLKFVVTRRTRTGFVIKLNKNAQFDIPFSWTALSVEGGRAEGRITENIVDVSSPTPTVTPTPQPSSQTLPETSISEATPSASTAPTAAQTLTVEPNELGFLRVRASANVESEEIAQVNPGQSFIIVGVENGWYKIEFALDQMGWVSGAYVTVE